LIAPSSKRPFGGLGASLGKRAMEASKDFMDARINPQRFDVRDKAVIEIRAKTWLL
jgi:hypothetical protein